jgi:signal transduction histidine kinase
VIFNMITNAYEAIGGAEGDSGRIRIAIESGASEIAVVVEDDGPGIVTEGGEDIFKTLVTSKPGGTGMGLDICRSIIRAHGGRLWAENRPEGGARVGFAIPAPREEQ